MQSWFYDVALATTNSVESFGVEMMIDLKWGDRKIGGCGLCRAERFGYYQCMGLLVYLVEYCAEDLEWKSSEISS